MLKHTREIKRQITDTLTAADAAFQFTQGRKHAQVRVTTRSGRTFTMPFAGSPSDRRGNLNLLTDLRRRVTA